MIRIVGIAEVVDGNCELIVEVGDNRCWPCKSNRGNPPLDTNDQPPSEDLTFVSPLYLSWCACACVFVFFFVCAWLFVSLGGEGLIIFK